MIVVSSVFIAVVFAFVTAGPPVFTITTSLANSHRRRRRAEGDDGEAEVAGVHAGNKSCLGGFELENHRCRGEELVGIFQKKGNFGWVECDDKAIEGRIDVIGDTMRGTRGILMDVFRQPDALLEACDRLAPVLVTDAVAQRKLGHDMGLTR